MDYVLRISRRAREKINRQPEPLHTFILDSLERLVAAPTRLSRTEVFVKRGQLAEFKFDSDGMSLWVTVVFQYGQDEQTLFIEEVKVEYGE